MDLDVLTLIADGTGPTEPGRRLEQGRTGSQLDAYLGRLELHQLLDNPAMQDADEKEQPGLPVSVPHALRLLNVVLQHIGRAVVRGDQIPDSQDQKGDPQTAKSKEVLGSPSLAELQHSPGGMEPQHAHIYLDAAMKILFSVFSPLRSIAASVSSAELPYLIRHIVARVKESLDSEVALDVLTKRAVKKRKTSNAKQHLPRESLREVLGGWAFLLRCNAESVGLAGSVLELCKGKNGTSVRGEDCVRIAAESLQNALESNGSVEAQEEGHATRMKFWMDLGHHWLTEGDVKQAAACFEKVAQAKTPSLKLAHEAQSLLVLLKVKGGNQVTGFEKDNHFQLLLEKLTSLRVLRKGVRMEQIKRVRDVIEDCAAVIRRAGWNLSHVPGLVELAFTSLYGERGAVPAPSIARSVLNSVSDDSVNKAVCEGLARAQKVMSGDRVASSETPVMIDSSPIISGGIHGAQEQQPDQLDDLANRLLQHVVQPVPDSVWASVGMEGIPFNVLSRVLLVALSQGLFAAVQPLCKAAIRDNREQQESKGSKPMETMMAASLGAFGLHVCSLCTSTTKGVSFSANDVVSLLQSLVQGNGLVFRTMCEIVSVPHVACCLGPLLAEVVLHLIDLIVKPPSGEWSALAPSGHARSLWSDASPHPVSIPELTKAIACHRNVQSRGGVSKLCVVALGALNTTRIHGSKNALTGATCGSFCAFLGQCAGMGFHWRGVTAEQWMVSCLQRYGPAIIFDLQRRDDVHLFEWPCALSLMDLRNVIAALIYTEEPFLAAAMFQLWKSPQAPSSADVAGFCFPCDASKVPAGACLASWAMSFLSAPPTAVDALSCAEQLIACAVDSKDVERVCTQVKLLWKSQLLEMAATCGSTCVERAATRILHHPTHSEHNKAASVRRTRALASRRLLGTVLRKACF